jgi:hypothetical protein
MTMNCNMKGSLMAMLRINIFIPLRMVWSLRRLTLYNDMKLPRCKLHKWIQNNTHVTNVTMMQNN